MADAAAPLASRLNYAACWEDVALLHGALRPAPGSRILSIASGGDNSLDLALGGAEVDAIDLSAPQLALVALKLAGAHLDLHDHRALLGLEPRPSAVRLWRLLRDRVDPEWRGYWDAHPELLERGLLRSGRFERYLESFRTRILPLVHRRRTVERWFELPDAPARREFWDRRWNNARWQALFRLFFSRPVMAARGRSPEQFAHVRGGIGGALMDRSRRALTELDPRENPYVQWILTGRIHREDLLPAYLTEPGHAGLREAAARIRLVHAPLDAHLAAQPPGRYHGYNLSDLFEYLDLSATAALLGEVARAGAPGARVAYWNLFVPRHRPAALADRVQRLPALSLRLYARDRSFVYGAFHVEEIR